MEGASSHYLLVAASLYVLDVVKFTEHLGHDTPSIAAKGSKLLSSHLVFHRLIPLTSCHGSVERPHRA